LRDSIQPSLSRETFNSKDHQSSRQSIQPTLLPVYTSVDLPRITYIMARLNENRCLKIVDAAAAGKYAVPALCCYNLEGILASVRAAEAKRSPVLIQLFPWAVDYANGILLHAAKEAADTATVPVGVHMDHAQSPDLIRKSAELGGLDGIMVDMSHYEKEENMSLTKELVAFCQERGIITEAEPGRIEGGEDGVSDTADLEGLLTTPEQAEEFVALGIDWLAPAFGNVHGKYGPKGPQLEFDRLKSIHKQVGDRVQLVLHGSDGFGEDLYAKCIEAGVSKCNINGAMNGEYTKIQKEKAGKIPLTTLIEEGTAAMQKVIEVHMDWMKSTGKA
jgi:fructose-bisphosphate aldolase, class II